MPEGLQESGENPLAVRIARDYVIKRNLGKTARHYRGFGRDVTPFIVSKARKTVAVQDFIADTASVVHTFETGHAAKDAIPVTRFMSSLMNKIITAAVQDRREERFVQAEWAAIEESGELQLASTVPVLADHAV